MKRDIDKTAAAGFVDSRSFVRPDGREERHGEDMTQLRRRVFERSYAQSSIFANPDYSCECKGECGQHEGRCWKPINWFTMELSHKIPRSKGRDDRETNVIASCHACHVAYEDWSPRWSKKEKL